MNREYTGVIKNGLFHGKGELTDSAAGYKYYGQFKKGLKDGKGIITWQNGDVYNGNFKRDVYHGYGSLKYFDGTHYNGEFWDGVIEGKGTCHYSNGNLYEGEFFKGKRDGKGVLKYPNGSIYRGQFKYDKKEGRGQMKYSNGCIYVGEFKNDLFNGKGIWKFPCGGQYEGAFSSNERIGRGIYKDHTGLELHGYFDNNMISPIFGSRISGLKLAKHCEVKGYNAVMEVLNLDYSTIQRHQSGLFTLPNSQHYKCISIHELIMTLIFHDINEKLNDSSLKLNKQKIEEILGDYLTRIPPELLSKSHSINEQKSAVNSKQCRYLFFDTETTGLPKNYKAPVHDLNNWPRLVQLAFIGYDEKGNELFKGNRIIKPLNFIIPADAAKIHGITTEKALSSGSDLAVVLKEFEELVNHASVLVAHNMDFDDKIVGSELLRMGFKNILAEKKKICTMKSSTSYCKINGPYGYKWPKLSELHNKLFGFEFQEAHNAAVDIEATAKCFWKLIELGVIKGLNKASDNTVGRDFIMPFIHPRDLDFMETEALLEGRSFDPLDPFLHLPIDPQEFFEAPHNDLEEYFMDQALASAEEDENIIEDNREEEKGPFQRLKLQLINSIVIEQDERVSGSHEKPYTLSQEQSDKFFQKVVKDLLIMIEKGLPFDFKEYAFVLYNRVLEKTGNPARSQTYAALIPSNILSARSASKSIKKLISPEQVATLAQLEADFEDFDKVGEYLGVAKEPAVVTDTSDTLKNAMGFENGVSKKVKHTRFRYAIVDASNKQKALYRMFVEQDGILNYEEEQGYPIYISNEFIGKRAQLLCRVLENQKVHYEVDYGPLEEIEKLVKSVHREDHFRTMEVVGKLYDNLIAGDRLELPARAVSNNSKAVSFKLQLIDSMQQEHFEFDAMGSPIIENGRPKKRSYTLFRYGIVGADKNQGELYRSYAMQEGENNYSEEQGYPIYFSSEFMGNECFFYLFHSANGKMEFVWDSTEVDALQAMAEKFPAMAPAVAVRIASIMLSGTTLQLDAIQEEQPEADIPTEEL